MPHLLDWSANTWSVASGVEVNKGRWGRSDGRMGPVKVRCKSVWLLHFAAALPICLARQLDNSTVLTGCVLAALRIAEVVSRLRKR